MQVLLVIPASALQTALASATDQMGQQKSDFTDKRLDDPGSLMSMGFMGGPNGAADSWTARLNWDPEVGWAVCSGGGGDVVCVCGEGGGCIIPVGVKHWVTS